MRKLGIILIGSLLMLGLTSCGNTEATSSTEIVEVHEFLDFMTLEETQEAEKALKSKIKDKSSSDITQMISDSYSQDGFFDKYMNEVGMKFKLHVDSYARETIDNYLYPDLDNIKSNESSKVEFVINVNKGFYVELISNSSLEINYKKYSESHTRTDKIENSSDVKIRYYKDGNTILDGKKTGDENLSIKGYSTSKEVDEYIGWNFTDEIKSLKDLMDFDSILDEPSLDIPSIEIPEIDSQLYNEPENITYRVTNGYLEVSNIFNLNKFVGFINEMLGAYLFSSVSYFTILLNKDFMISGINAQFNTDIGTHYKQSTTVSLGISFGDYDYEDVSNIEEYNSWQYFKGFMLNFFNN